MHDIDQRSSLTRIENRPGSLVRRDVESISYSAEDDQSPACQLPSEGHDCDTPQEQIGPVSIR